MVISRLELLLLVRVRVVGRHSGGVEHARRTVRELVEGCRRAERPEVRVTGQRVRRRRADRACRRLRELSLRLKYIRR